MINSHFTKNLHSQISSLRILFIASDNYSASGAFLSMVTLAKIMKEKQHAEVLVVLPCAGSGQKLLEEQNISYRHIKSYNWTIPIKHSFQEKIKYVAKSFLNICSILEIEKIIDEYKPNIVHINTSWTYVGAVAAYRRKIPCVWHIREFLEEDQEMQFWNRDISLHIMNRSDCVIAISKGIFRKYKPLLKSADIKIIYNGIDVNRFYKPEKKIFQNQKIKMLCVGGLNAGKGQSLIIKACAEVKRRCDVDFELYIVGEGIEERNLKEMTKSLGLVDCIYFEGFQLNTQDYYHKADIALVPSKMEAFGRVTIEAMLSGNLVIGSDSGATPELIGNDEYGYLYKSGDENDLAKKILDAFLNQNQAISRMEAGREYAYRYFSAERNADDIYLVYQKLLKMI